MPTNDWLILFLCLGFVYLLYRKYLRPRESVPHPPIPAVKPMPKPKYIDLKGHRWKFRKEDDEEVSTENAQLAMLQEIGDHNIQILEALNKHNELMEQQNEYWKKVFGGE